jgi:hypothetical protein
MDDMNAAARDLAMGGEDEERQDFIPPWRRGARGVVVAYLDVNILENGDGSATVWYYTNDADNDGAPDRTDAAPHGLVTYWTEAWPSAADALRQLVSGVQPSGRVVTVLHNGVPVG